MYQGCIPKKTKNRRPIDEIAPKKQKMYLVPRHVYVGTYVPGLHPPPQKEQKNMGYFAIYHAVPHRITPKKQANSPATSLLSTVVVWALCLCHLHDLSFFRPTFFVVLLLSIVWTHHRTDRNTSKQNPATLSPEGQACSLSA